MLRLPQGSQKSLINMMKDFFIDLITGHSRGFGSTMPGKGSKVNIYFL